MELVRELVMMRGEAGAEGEPVRERRLRMMRFMMGRPVGRRTFPRSLLVLHMKVLDWSRHHSYPHQRWPIKGRTIMNKL